MGTKYRVDVSDSPVVVPCGMNSIRYLGDNWSEARTVFAATQVGRDAWNQENILYGVTLSVWSGQHLTGDYVVKVSKGFNLTSVEMTTGK